MFKKPRRNFRRKRDSESDDESHSENSPSKDVTQAKTASQTSAKSSIPPKGISAQSNDSAASLKKVPSSNTVLSFASEEEADGEVFQIKKPSHSKRIVKQLKKESQKGKDSDGGSVKFDVSYDNDSSGTGNGLKSVKKEEPPSDNESHGDNSADDDDENDSKSGLSDILKSGQIPDASLIHMVRKRRQLARERGDEFIPLDSGASNTSGRKKSSRLIRDDDDDKSDDSDDEQFALTSRQKDLQRRRMEETILAANEESHSDASDQELAWEEQQIRKGVSIPAQPAAPTSSADYFADYQATYSYGGVSGNFVASVLSVSNTAAVAYTSNEPPSDLPALTVDSVKKRLNDRLSEMCTVHRVHVHERDDMCSRVEMSTESIARLQSQTAGLEEQYRFFQETRGYVRDLVECLNEKMTSMNYVERCMTKLYKERADKLIKRRQEDVKDQSLEYMPGKAAAAVSGLEDGIMEDKKRRRADREGRRVRRKRKREVMGIVDHNDGLSTDDEVNNSESSKFNFTRDELTKSVATMFDDVTEEFCQLDLIRSRFEMWKKDYADSYNEAFIGLCLPKLFSPFVKLELICWNPLEPSCSELEDSRWFNSLIFYGHAGGSQELADEDLKLLPNIVDKVILPKLTTLVETLWDPLSLQQTLRLSKLIQKLVEEYPTVNAESKNTQLLIKAVVQRLKKSLDDDIFMPLYPKQILENRTSDAAVFFHRQFWTCIKLLRSITSWQGIVSNRQLMELAFDSLINRYLVVALQNSVFNTECLTKCQAIMEALPRDWFFGHKSDATLPQLENLCRCLVNLAATLCTSQQPQTVLNKETRDILRQAVRLLLSVGAKSHAVALANRAGLSVG